MSTLQEDKKTRVLELPEELVNHLRKCQATNPTLHGMKMDELVTLALTMYLETKSGKPHLQTDRAQG